LTSCFYLIGDVSARLRELPDAYFHCVVTSPPYFGLRDYGAGNKLAFAPTIFNIA